MVLRTIFNEECHKQSYIEVRLGEAHTCIRAVYDARAAVLSVCKLLTFRPLYMLYLIDADYDSA